jgi:hypothetical protein
MADFIHKNSWFFGSGTAEWNVLMLGYDIVLALLHCKKFVPSPVKSKWRLYSRWRLEFLYFSPNIFKNDILVHFSLIFYILGKIKLLWKTFTWKFKMAE